MQLRHCRVLLVLLITMPATERWAIAELIPPSPMAVAPLVTQAPEAEMAARTGLRSLPDLVTEKNARMFGFLNPAEASSAQYGAPFQTYIVNLKDLPNFDPAVSKLTGEKGLVRPIGRIIWPLLTDRQDGMGPKARSAVVVSQRVDKNDKTKFTWAATNWGLTSLIQQVTLYRETVQGFANGILVWIPALNLHFLGDNYTEDLILIPLADRPAYGLKKGQAISARIVFALYAREAKARDDSNPG